MREVGLDAYRFSLSWPRILPEGEGAVNQAGLDHYRRFVDDLLDNGIKPLVTLYHWDFPWALHEKGGWRNPQSVGWYRNYAGIVFRALAGKVETFITVNEPYLRSLLHGDRRRQRPPRASGPGQGDQCPIRPPGACHAPPPSRQRAGDRRLSWASAERARSASPCR